MTTFLENLIKPLVKSNFMSKRNDITIKDRIVKISKEFAISDEMTSRFLASIMELIERAKSPDLFCQKCDSRMSIDLDSGILQCFNCGFKKKIELTSYEERPAVVNNLVERKAPPERIGGGKPNTKILNALDKIEERDNKKPPKNSIQELANSRGGAKVTKEDDEYLKKNIPGAANANINWV
jgi:ribosomal protein L37AE/L43A